VKKAQHLLWIIAFLMSATLSFKVTASSHQDSTFTVSYRDSLVSNKQNKIIYNNIFINNISQDTIVINGYVSLPNGWKSLGNCRISIQIPPAAVRNISVNIMKQMNVPASWQKVNFVLWQQNTTDSQRYFYNINVEAQPGFRSEQTIQEITLVDKPDVMHLGVHLKNTGNVSDLYTLQWKNYDLNIDVNEKVNLPAGKDTVYYFPLKISSTQWNKLYKETIHLTVRSSYSNSAYIDYKINRPQSTIKQNQSAYNNIPLSFEAGAMIYGNHIAYTYGGRGLFQFGEHSLSLYYRSKQFGATQGLIQKNIFIANYDYRNWHVQAGQTSLSDNFIAIGNGGRISYKVGDKTEYSLAAVVHDPAMSIFQSDGIQAKAKYGVDKLVVTNTAEVNSDKINKIDAVVVNNNVQIIKKEDLRVSASIGGGVEDNKALNHTSGDISMGYDFAYNFKKWAFYSNVDFHGKDFPGYKKGLNMQNHGVTYSFGKPYLGAIYSISQIRRNYFRDTLFNTDILNYNSKKYGLIAGYNDGRFNSSVGGGIYKQTGISSMFNSDHYYYTDINIEQKIDKLGTSKVSFTSQNAYSNSISSLVTSDMLSANLKFFGVSGAYVRTPIVNNEGNGRVSRVYNETFNGGPYVTFHFFRKTLFGNVRYMFYKTLKDNYTRTGIEANLTYNSIKTGTFVQLTGYMPLRDDNVLQGLPINQTRYGLLTVSQSVKLPVITHRKFYDLKVVVYYDANSNNIKDKDEKTLGAMNMGINDEIMMTDENGIVDYENVKEGSYKLDLVNSKSEDLVPVDGPIQSITIKNNTVYQVPFKKGRAINGSIKIVSDNFSTYKYGANMIEINAEDSTGHKYKTFTDENGNFNLFVPEGVYTVSLNEDAFADSDFKAARVSYTIDLFSHDNSYVVFEIKQKKRKIRFLNQ